MKETRQSSDGGPALLKENGFLLSWLEHCAPITRLADSLNETYHGSAWSHDETGLSFEVIVLDISPVLC